MEQWQIKIIELVMKIQDIERLKYLYSLIKSLLELL